MLFNFVSNEDLHLFLFATYALDKNNDYIKNNIMQVKYYTQIKALLCQIWVKTELQSIE